VPVNSPCITGSGSVAGGGAQPQAQGARQTTGVDALNQLLGQGLPK
jgi:hypothetical protein